MGSLANVPRRISFSNTSPPVQRSITRQMAGILANHRSFDGAPNAEKPTKNREMC